MPLRFSAVTQFQINLNYKRREFRAFCHVKTKPELVLAGELSPTVPQTKTLSSMKIKKILATLAVTVASTITLSLTGCTTAQTLAAQFTDVPLPGSVARNQYGTCANCAQNPQPNCIDCRRIQTERRDAAGLSNKAFVAKYGNRPPAPAVNAGYAPTRQNRNYQNQNYQNQNYQNQNYQNQDYQNYQNQTNRNSQYYPVEYDGVYSNNSAQTNQRRNINRYIVPDSNRTTSSGTPYPVRWYMPGRPASPDPQVSAAILKEQLVRAETDPELAESLLDFIDNVRVKEGRANPNDSWRNTAAAQAQNSGYRNQGQNRYNQASYQPSEQQNGYSALGY